jgi:hypothetical protein
VLVVVAGAGNAGVSAVVETFGARGGPPPVVRVGGPLGLLLRYFGSSPALAVKACWMMALSPVSRPVPGS